MSACNNHIRQHWFHLIQMGKWKYKLKSYLTLKIFPVNKQYQINNNNNNNRHERWENSELLIELTYNH